MNLVDDPHDARHVAATLQTLPFGMCRIQFPTQNNGATLRRNNHLLRPTDAAHTQNKCGAAHQIQVAG